MNKEYCENKVRELYKEKELLEEESDKIRDYLISLNSQKDRLIMSFIDAKQYDAILVYLNHVSANRDKIDRYKPIIDKALDIYERLNRIDYEINRYSESIIDTEWKRMSGDIIITDPCYLFEDDEYYDIVGRYGLIHDTIYGDWSCSTFDCDTREKLGSFCADAGLVCVIPLSDVLQINPNFNWNIMESWAATLIKDFDGEVRITVKEE